MRKLGQMFRNEPVRDAFGRTGAWDGALQGSQPIMTHGLAAGTQVATAHGWRNVEALQEGDKVLTFDAGLQPLRRVTRNWTYVDHGVAPVHNWPLSVPAGALGNRTAMILMPEQSVMVESDAGEDMFGDPFTLIPAAALEGYKGIVRVRPDEPMETVVLEFDTEQVVFANVGALFHCPAPEDMTIANLLEDHPAPGYEVLSLSRARGLVSALIEEDVLDAAWMAQEHESRKVLRYAH